MCMIAFRPVGKGKVGNMPNAVIDTALTRHPDGYGIAWRENGFVRTAKFGPDARKEFRKMVRRLDNAGFEYAAHFRQATHGPACKRLSHPFVYEDPTEGRVAILHNGVIDIKTTAEESDTEVFVRDVLAKLPSAWWRNPALTYLVGEAIGWSKLVIMTPSETQIIFEDRGSWDGGLWYSSNHKPAATTTYQYNGGRWFAGPTVSHKDQRPYLYDVKAADAPATPPVVQSAVLQHGGHTLSAIKDIRFDRDGDFQDAVICDTCFTIGDLYVIDNAYYVDMSHKMGLLAVPEAIDDDEESVLPETRAMVRVN